jgi:hypothetical protein
MPFKVFNNFEVFTAADANILMRQSVIVLDSLAERNAIVSPPQGMLIFRTDIGGFERHTGTVWVPDRAKWASFRTSALAIGNASWATVTFSSSQNLRGGAVSEQSSGNHTIAHTGLYRIEAGFMWAANGVGNRGVRIRSGSTVLVESIIQSFDTNGRGQSLSLPAIPLTLGDTINVQAFQNSGGALNLTQASIVIETA